MSFFSLYHVGEKVNPPDEFRLVCQQSSAVSEYISETANKSATKPAS